MPAPSVHARAYGKVNLALSVGPPAPPRGYHPIASWFACVDLHDDLTVSRLDPAALSEHRVEWAQDAPRVSPIDWPLEKDLAVRAHRALEAESGRALPVRLLLQKRIPVGGGLGGGSSNAAAMLRAIVALYALAVPEDSLRRVAMKLGSDVAFFLDTSRTPLEPARPALVEGYGETLHRVEQAPAAIVLFLPPFGCPTGAVYQAYDRSPCTLRTTDVRGLIHRAHASGHIDSRGLFNDLTQPACAVEQRMAGVLSTLRASLGTVVHVTGSGSTMFALADDGTHAQSLAKQALAAVPGLAAVPTRLI